MSKKEHELLQRAEREPRRPQEVKERISSGADGGALQCVRHTESKNIYCLSTIIILVVLHFGLAKSGHPQPRTPE